MTASLHYEAPPLIEVVYDLEFQPLDAFRAPHFGLFWSRLVESFPRCEQAPPLGDFQIIAGIPLPRVWLLGEPFLIQMQNNRFILNWRKDPDFADYPRYPKVKDKFRELYANFSDFLSEYNLGVPVPTACELRYVNQIDQGSGWNSLGDLSKVFRHICWNADSESILANPLAIAWTGHFQLPGDMGKVVINIKHGNKADDTSVLILELVAQGPVGDDVWGWFDVARDSLNRSFRDVTADEIQENVWRRK
ncbi:TIGR04255 family protein [Immundisolibacter sp.]|uniref:TIGR04255 family protein n=1 Tax=Immundisolibacter sp. TaxID=1934948 RepID=UPI0035616685